MALQLALVKIPVADLAASLRFYETLLDCKASFVAEQFGWAQFDHPEPGLALYVSGAGGGHRTLGGSVDFHLATADIDALHDQIASVASVAAIHENADGSRSLEVEDPDRNILKTMATSQ
ncbi:hypothetical protein GCM10007385_37330 [Tateyamaria omphalii]|uniref:VOC family protein n=1 Tax=Tateyamaria omphalii TaxID=299262 RepID=UPI00167AB097|nr:VOC family protein [Tateyamaria omphalii]GGX64754.1 hypothetical protein GCM10007385_37330 [Tateyamaria omphalii]